MSFRVFFGELLKHSVHLGPLVGQALELLKRILLQIRIWLFVQLPQDKVQRISACFLQHIFEFVVYLIPFLLSLIRLRLPFKPLLLWWKRFGCLNPFIKVLNVGRSFRLLRDGHAVGKQLSILHAQSAWRCIITRVWGEVAPAPRWVSTFIREGPWWPDQRTQRHEVFSEGLWSIRHSSRCLRGRRR